MDIRWSKNINNGSMFKKRNGLLFCFQGYLFEMIKFSLEKNAISIHIIYFKS